MTTQILNGDCLELMKDLEDKSVDLLICDLPYVDINGKAETNCKWNQSLIDLEKFWKEFKRIRKSKRTACIHFCSTKFGFSLIKSWEKGFKMDMVWKKRNKTGGLQSRYRPMRNHEMVYFFYEQAPKYNRDKYHKRINNVKHAKSETTKEKKTDKIENKIIRKTIPLKERKAMGEQSGIYEKNKMTFSNFEPPNPASVLEEKTDIYGESKSQMRERSKKRKELGEYDIPNPASVLEEDIYGEDKQKQLKRRNEAYLKSGNVNTFEPVNPASIVDEDEPVSMFESEKVFIGKRHHQTEKPQDILEFFIKYWSDEGDVILDPTMGSGSTGVACKKLKRDFIGFEMNEDIFKIAQKRIEN